MTRSLAPVFLALALAVGPVAARADVIPPDVTACERLAVGAACGGAMGVARGTCQNATCARLDYASWNRDAMAMPPTVQYACVRCLAGTADGGPAPTLSGDGGCQVPAGPVGARAAPWLLMGLAWAAARLWRARR